MGLDAEEGAETQEAQETQAGQEEAPVIRFEPLRWQVEARKLRARYPKLVANCGVLTGKTEWGSATILESMWNNPGRIYWWVAGLDWQIRRFWESFKPAAEFTGAYCKDSPHCYAELPPQGGKPGAKLYGVTAKSVESLSAYHPYGIWGDEIAKITPTAWNFLRIRMLNVSECILMSTPRPNFWRTIVQDARDRRDGQWALIECTTAEGGLVSAAELEALKKDIPSRIYRQEILAIIVSGEGAVFRHVDRASEDDDKSKALKPKKGEIYIVGYDSAKSQDWGVVAVRKVSTDQIVRIERWQEPIDFHAQAKLCVAIAEEYNRAQIFHDATSAGGKHMNEELKRQAFKDGKKPSIFGVTFNNDNKGNMVEDLVMRLEQEKIWFPHEDYGEQYRIAQDEFTAFEMDRSKSGLTYTYGAPQGGHDDCVTAIGLAFWKKYPKRVGVYRLERSSSI